MPIAAALIYWVVVALWVTVLATAIVFYLRNPHTFGTTRLLLIVIGIDTLRNIFENVYFGIHFGGLYGIFPASWADFTGSPGFLIVPKLVNLAAGSVVLGLLLWRWLPLAVKERNDADQRATDLEALAAVDFLTGLYNRRHFETLVLAEIARSQRYVRPLSLLLIDIDHFKAVNDRFGHAAGDQVLRNVAATCRAEKRDSDVLARFGGDEFAVMLPETTQTAAVQFAERLRNQVRNSMPTISGEQIRVTISIGVPALRYGRRESTPCCSKRTKRSMRQSGSAATAWSCHHPTTRRASPKLRSEVARLSP